MRYVVMVLASLIIALPAVATNVDEYIPGELPGSDTPWQGDVWRAPTVVLFENGPLVNSPGTGVGGADESVLLNESLGMANLGWGHQADPTIDNRIADDFTVPDGEMWDITMITTFAYQTGAPQSGTIDGVFIEIWDGVPGISNLVWGDIDTDYLDSTGFSNVYRVTETTTGQSTDRAIQANQSVPTPDLLLASGTYYMAWQSDGDPGFSGPWANPIAETDGDGITGNGLQSITGGPYDPATDPGTATEQGFPFILEGDLTGGTPTLETSWGAIKATFAE